MKNRLIVVLALTLLSQQLLAMEPAAAWVRSVTITSVGSINNGGEVVVFTVEGETSNPAKCPNGAEYAHRDKETLRSALALLMSALVAQHQVDLYVTGSCDISGRPEVLGVVIRANR